jgi:ATP-dependent Zn protease
MSARDGLDPSPPTADDRRRSAVHESGHAVVAHLLGIPVKSMTPQSGGALAASTRCWGYAPDSDPTLLPQQCENMACMALGGEAMEVLEYGSADSSGGAALG